MICDVAFDVVRTHVRDVVVPRRRVDSVGRMAKVSIRSRWVGGRRHRLPRGLLGSMPVPSRRHRLRGREKRPTRNRRCRPAPNFSQGSSASGPPVGQRSPSKGKGVGPQCSVAHRIRDVSVDVVGTPLRDVVVPQRVAPVGRMAKAGSRNRAWRRGARGALGNSSGDPPARKVSRARTATPSIPPPACTASTGNATAAAGDKLTR
jgi:hypothetical protein